MLDCFAAGNSVSKAEEVPVSRYQDYRAYIKSIYQRRKERNHRYSLRRFSLEAGFSSPGYIHSVLSGTRNLGDTGIRLLSRHLGLDKNDTDYLRLMTGYTNSNSGVEKAGLLSQMQQITASRSGVTLKEDQDYFLKNRLCPVILALASAHGADFNADIYWIMRQLRHEVSEQEVRGALSFLLKSGLLVRKDGSWTHGAGPVRISPKMKERSLGVSQQEVIGEALRALADPPEEREFGHLTITIALDRFEELKDRIQKIREDILDWSLSEKGEQGKKVLVCVNTQLYSLSRRNHQRQQE